MSIESTPFFSVCIPVYNAEKHLEECVLSVINQTYKSFEIILVNDGSSDGSAAICDALAAKHTTVKAFHKNNEGPMLARHDAVKAAKGKYLLFLDSDDVFVPDAMELLKTTLAETEADTVIFDIYCFSEETRTKVITEKFADKSIFENAGKKAFYEYFVVQSALNSMCRKCIKRSVYDADKDYSAYKNMVQGEDKLVSLQCLDSAEKIVYLKTLLYGYRMNPNSTTHNASLKNYRDVQALHEEVEKYMLSWGLSAETVRLQKTRILIAAYNCVYSVSMRVLNKKADMKELVEAVLYISSDDKYRTAFDSSGKLLPSHQRKICKLVLDNKPKRVLNRTRILNFLGKIKHAVKS